MAMGWEAMSFFVCCLYDSKAALKIVSKSVEDAVAEGTWDIVLVEEACMKSVLEWVHNRSSYIYRERSPS